MFLVEQFGAQGNLGVVFGLIKPMKLAVLFFPCWTRLFNEVSKSLFLAYFASASCAWSGPANKVIDNTQPIASGLIEYWPLNESSASSTTELVNGRVATLSAGATWSTDQNGDAAINFDGGLQAQVLTTAAFLALADINTFTIAIAYLPRNAGAGAPMTIFSVDSGNSNMATKIKMNHNGSGSLSAVIPPGAGVYVAETGASVVSANTWQQIVYSRNGLGSGSNKIYVDGVSKTLTVDNTTASFNDNNTGQKHLIGALADGGPENLDGKISWIGIWGRQLSAAEMITLAATPYVLLKPSGGSTMSGRSAISGNVTIQ